MEGKRPTSDDFVKFSIDGVKLSDVEKFDGLAAEVFPNHSNPRKRLFYCCLFMARAVRELASPKKREGEEQDETY